MGKLIDFTKGINRYRKLAEARSEKDDFSGALAFLFSAKSMQENYEVVMDIAYTYADMGLLELSNKYWYKYIDTAPKDKVSVAFEELAVNYFYMDNYWASSYYFHLKLTTDGQIMKEGLDQEIIDFFSGEEMKRDAYRIVYPIEKANYTFETKRSRHALALGAFKEARAELEKIPLSRRTEENAGDLAVSCFMSDDLESAEKVCRQSIEQHGENVTAYCNLSTIYDMKEDFDKAEFYYKKALGVEKGNKGEEYKIATCAIERADHLTVKRCLEKILLDRPYELTMRFFYGLCFLNLGEYEKGKEELLKVYRTNPQDGIARHYLSLAEQLIEENQNAVKMLPFEYVKELPKKTAEKYSEKVKELINAPEKISVSLKNAQTKKILEWALINGEGQTSRDAAFVLATAYTPFVKKLFLNSLIDPEVKDEVKRVIIYVLAVKGHKEKFGLVSGAFHSKIKFRKLLCEKDGDGLYTSAYALCVARIVFWDAENVDKAAKMTDRVYKALKDKISAQDATNEELAALILSECEYKWCKTDRDVMNMFEISLDKLNKLKNMVKGEKSDD